MRVIIFRLRIFDQLLYYCEIDLLPPLSHSNCSIDRFFRVIFLPVLYVPYISLRWFNIARANSEGGISGEAGKILLEFSYETEFKETKNRDKQQDSMLTASLQHSCKVGIN